MDACYCRGPQNGEPLCPCMMRDVKVVDGRYVRVSDLGPANKKRLSPLNEYLNGGTVWSRSEDK